MASRPPAGRSDRARGERRGLPRTRAGSTVLRMTPGHVVRMERQVHLPDPMRVERCRRQPEIGPRILFFSGGSALRGLSRSLKLYTENSIHLITAFDSGGSSALLRRAFRMPSVGDLRNRLMALADETIRGNPETYRLFSHRFPGTGDPSALREEFDSMVSGTHELVRAVPRQLRRLIRTHLRVFSENVPSDFDFRNASIGNLILAGGYLNNDRDIDSVLFLFSQLVEVRGTVALTTDCDYHLAAELEDGARIVGQHRLTGKTEAAISSPVREISLVDSLDDPKPVAASIDDSVRRLIARAELICYPMGSFYSSVVANLLPDGVGQAIASVGCPKVYVPNTGTDPEQVGMTIAGSAETLIRSVRRTAGSDTPVRDILNLVILDESDEAYTLPLEEERLRQIGVPFVRLPLHGDGGRPRLDPVRLTEVLVSLV